MYLKNLELSGFKSFAKKTDLSFNTPITSIVGPNGSGKSNIAEAFSFVLGEQSFKSMRGKKGEDLIWNGSNEAGRANRASVKIVFDNSRRFLNLDFDEVSVERTVFRDGVNEYSINGSRVRLKDVLELLASAHIGASGHHIISQGEADRILNSNAKERKAMVEDALGLKIYQYKMEESERRLDKTEENIKSVESLRREVLPHLKFLKKQVEKIEKALEMRSQLASRYKEYLKRENIYLTDRKAKIAAEKTPVEKRLNELEHDLKDAKSILERSKSHDQKSSRILLLEEKIRKIREEKDGLVREIGRIEGQTASEERIQKKERELSKTFEQNVPIVEIENLAAELDARLNQAETETEPIGLKKIFDGIRGLISGFIAKHKQKTNAQNILDSEKVLGGLKGKKIELDKKLSDIRSEEENHSKEYSALRSEIDEEKDTNRAAEKKVFEVMTAQNEVIAQRSAIRTREEAMKAEEDDYKRELGEAAAIVGREVLDFENFDLGEEAEGTGRVGENFNENGSEREKNSRGQREQIATEDRYVQHDRRRELEKIKIRLEESGIGASDDVMKEFREVSERDAFLVGELADLEKSAESLRTLIDELSQKISVEFSTGLEKINKQFEEFFSLMFGGGQAKLVLVKEKKRRPIGIDSDSDSDLEATVGIIGASLEGEEIEAEEGIDISVNLPRKKVKGLMMLSGGERALTSIALIFAMSQVKPPPFIILDETDAALDESNSKKYGDMIENLAKYSQLILITHNRETMSRAGVLYGVTMLSGVSKLLSIQFDEAVEAGK
ncbi:MAG: AAA family ATPase [Patescibacteria group bacterium]|mgnify:CR=1 FL=1